MSSRCAVGTTRLLLPLDLATGVVAGTFSLGLTAPQPRAFWDAKWRRRGQSESVSEHESPDDAVSAANEESLDSAFQAPSASDGPQDAEISSLGEDAIYQRYIETVFELARVEMRDSPRTYFHYQERKEYRYCDPYRWMKLKASSKAAFDKHMTQFFRLDKVFEAKGELAKKKAFSLVLAGGGTPIEKMFPGFLQEVVEKGWLNFLEDLHRAHQNPLRVTPANIWGFFATARWCAGSESKSAKDESLWPLCFWTDEAIVSFFTFGGAELTLDVWRKFRRQMGLSRPDYTIIAEATPVYDGCLEDGAALKVKGIRLRKQVRRLPTKGT
jgi:hypothetical protein